MSGDPPAATAARPHEAQFLTPWLAQWPESFGEALGLKLELKGREMPVGRYRADLERAQIGESPWCRSGAIPALVRCAHGPLGPRPRPLVTDSLAYLLGLLVLEDIERDAVVVVENMYDAADHDHIGKLTHLRSRKDIVQRKCESKLEWEPEHQADGQPCGGPARPASVTERNGTTLVPGKSRS